MIYLNIFCKYRNFYESIYILMDILVLSMILSFLIKDYNT